MYTLPTACPVTEKQEFRVRLFGLESWLSLYNLEHITYLSCTPVDVYVNWGLVPAPGLHGLSCGLNELRFGLARDPAHKSQPPPLPGPAPPCCSWLCSFLFVFTLSWPEFESLGWGSLSPATVVFLSTNSDILLPEKSRSRADLDSTSGFSASCSLWKCLASL